MTENWKRELFLNRKFEVNSFRIGTIGLGSSIKEIDYFDIVDIYVEKTEYSHLRFKDRLELLTKGNGWIHLASGVSFEVKKGIVNQIKISPRFLQDHKTKKKDIIEIFGKPDYELVERIFDFNIDSIVLVYNKKKIFAFIDPSTNSLKELHFGEFDANLYERK